MMLTENEKTDRLEKAVISKAPEEIRSIYKELGEISFTAYALGLACLYRGIDTVKVLVECGADFRYPGEDEPVDDDMRFSYYKRAANKVVPDYSLMLIGRSKLADKIFKLLDGKKILSVSERAKALDYLCDNAEKTGLNPQKLLYFSIRDGNEQFYSVLKKHEVSIHEKTRWIFNSASNFGYSWDMDDFLNVIDTDRFLKTYGMVVKELDGEKIKLNRTFFYSYIAIILSPESFEFVLDNFTGLNQMNTMKMLVDEESVSCLAIAADYGWLKLPRKRDELIQYASDNGKTESLAWLLDFKNRTADLASEREKAEKKIERELNADPNSITELKKIWKFEKREDNTVTITGYKGNRTEIVVPEKIGEDTVAAIGEYAFSPDAKRIREEQRNFRKTITKITLPDTVEHIGEFAFFKCQSLTEINIPEKLTEISKGMLDITGIKDIVIGGNIKKISPVALYGCRDLKSVRLCEGVREIDAGAFYLCTELETIVIPRSVQKIADCTMSENPFHGCHKLTVLLYKGSYAESYCENAKITSKYIDDEK